MFRPLLFPTKKSRGFLSRGISLGIMQILSLCALLFLLLCSSSSTRNAPLNDDYASAMIPLRHRLRGGLGELRPRTDMLKKAPVEGRPPGTEPDIGDWKVTQIWDNDEI